MNSITKIHILEQVFEIIDELLLMNLFTTESEVISIISLALKAYIKLDFANVILQAAEITWALVDTSGAIISVLETIFIKYIQNSGRMDTPIMNAFKV